MATKPLRPAATPGRLPRRRRRAPLASLGRLVPIGLALVGLVALVLLVLGLLGIHAITAHFRIH